IRGQVRDGLRRAHALGEGRELGRVARHADHARPAFGALAGRCRANAFRTSGHQPGLAGKLVGTVAPEDAAQVVADGAVAWSGPDVELDDLGKWGLGHFETDGGARRRKRNPWHCRNLRRENGVSWFAFFALDNGGSL